jgi:hypothetical protein
VPKYQSKARVNAVQNNSEEPYRQSQWCIGQGRFLSLQCSREGWLISDIYLDGAPSEEATRHSDHSVPHGLISPHSTNPREA